jgi:uncharacterized protein YndB with AHSA1/START domain
MVGLSADHGTVVVEHVLNVPVSRTYAAFADPRERERWGAPSETATLIYDSADFRVGGVDLIRCGAKADPRYRVEVRYIDIVAEKRVVWTETIRDGDSTMAVNITTTEFIADGPRTKLRVTIQVTSFVGANMFNNTKAGHEGSLAAMSRYLER